MVLISGFVYITWAGHVPLMFLILTLQARNSRWNLSGLLSSTACLFDQCFQALMIREAFELGRMVHVGLKCKTFRGASLSLSLRAL